MDGASVIRLFLLAAIWGASFLFMRIAAPELGAALVAEVRVLLAAMFLWAASVFFKRSLRVGENWRHYLIVGFFNSALPFILFSYAALQLSASMLSILNATAPLWGCVIAAALDRQRIPVKTFSGLVLGVIGVGVLLGFDTAVVSEAGWLPCLAAIGAGIYVGSAVIICSAIIGLGWRAYIEKHNKPLTWWRLYFLGLSVQITVLCLMFFMPEHLRYKIIAAIAPTILIFYPIGTMLLGMILSRQEERRLAERELHISRQILNRERGLLRGLIDALPDHIYIKDKEGKYLGCNKAFQNFTGHQEADLIGKTDQDFAESNHAITDNSDTLQVINDLLPINREAWTHEQDGSPILLESQLAPFLDMDGEPQGIVGISRDITEKRKAEERILTLSQAIEQSPVSVVITNLQGEVEYVNSTFESITGYSQAEVLGKDSSILKSGKTPPGRYTDMWAKLVQGDSWQGEFQNKKKNGEIFWEHAHIAPVLDAEGEVRHFLAVKQDVTKQKAQEEKILHQAHFDGLTELPNRFLAMNRLETMMHEAKRSQHQVAVLFLDMDDFKKVNDTLGHDMGDKILVEAAKRFF
jgi:PAS domain S-box-containing protein